MNASINKVSLFGIASTLFILTLYQIHQLNSISKKIDNDNEYNGKVVCFDEMAFVAYGNTFTQIHDSTGGYKSCKGNDPLGLFISDSKKAISK